MAAALRFLLLTFALVAWASGAQAATPKPVPFVMQMTVGDSDAQRHAFLQIAKVLEDIGPGKLKNEVVTYEGALLPADCTDRNGIQFKACHISMRARGLKEADFPLEVEFVPAAAPEMVWASVTTYPAQQDNCLTSLVKVWAQSFNPSTMVR